MGLLFAAAGSGALNTTSPLFGWCTLEAFFRDMVPNFARRDMLSSRDREQRLCTVQRPAQFFVLHSFPLSGAAAVCVRAADNTHGWGLRVTSESVAPGGECATELHPCENVNA